MAPTADTAEPTAQVKASSDYPSGVEDEEEEEELLLLDELEELELELEPELELLLELLHSAKSLVISTALDKWAQTAARDIDFSIRFYFCLFALY